MATQRVGEVLSAALAGSRMTVDDATVLNQVDVLGPVTPSVLAARLGVSPSTLSYRLRTLEDRFWLERRRNPDDGRSVLVSLSPRGRRAWKRVLPAWVAALRGIEDALGVPEKRVSEVLRAIAAAAESRLV